MATLADSFLADLDDLSDDEAPDDVAAADASVPQSAQDGERGSGGAGSSRPSGDTLNAVSQLTGSERYARVVAQVREALAADAKAAASSGDGTAASSQPHLGVVDENAYRLIVECNALSADIDDEIQTVHNFVRDQYRVKFPELESLVTHPIDYARVVRAIGNEMDVTRVDLDAVLPSAAVMVVSVTAATTAGAPLREATLKETLAACDRQMQMDEDRRQLVQLVQSRMDRTAPNLSAVLGSEVAARLMGVAGGLTARLLDVVSEGVVGDVALHAHGGAEA